MSERIEKAMRLADLQRHPGWKDLLSIANEQMNGNSDWIFNTLASHPEKLTGRTAIAKANRLKGVSELLEAIDSEIRFANPSTQGQGS